MEVWNQRYKIENLMFQIDFPGSHENEAGCSFNLWKQYYQNQLFKHVPFSSLLKYLSNTLSFSQNWHSELKIWSLEYCYLGAIHLSLWVNLIHWFVSPLIKNLSRMHLREESKECLQKNGTLHYFNMNNEESMESLIETHSLE